MSHFPRPLSSEANAVVAKIGEISGENLRKCMQCGTCSSLCPMVPSMPFTTRQAIHLLQFGRTEEVVHAEIARFCASCHTCTVNCPRGIDVVRVFEAVRLLALRENVDLIRPRDIPAETLAAVPQIAFVAGFRKLTA
jgi:heterodisulfide reductase subunit C2